MALFIAVWALFAYSVLSWSATAGLMDTAHWNLPVERSRLTTMVVSSLAVEPIPPATYGGLFIGVFGVFKGGVSLSRVAACS